MKSDSYSAFQLFQQAQQLLVPQFQRPYVWDENSQWKPLWEDIETQAYRMLTQPLIEHRPHFLGAVVLQQQITPPDRLQERSIIDGQQRLTTLQVLIDAVQAEMSVVGATVSAEFLRELIENDKKYWTTDDDRFKLLPTNRDKPAYREVMGAEPPIDYASLVHKKDQIPKAHAYFAVKAREFLTKDGPDHTQARAEALRTAIRNLLRMVVISLDPDEDAQEIFETLNSRGTPLSAADLIKNFLFQRLQNEGADVEHANATYWHLFETAFWENKVSAGRREYPRAALFLTHYLISRVGEPVRASEVFQRFKKFVTDDWTGTTIQLVQEIHRLATVFEGRMTRIESGEGYLDPVDMFLYRTQVMDIDAVTPLFLLLTDPSLPAIPDNELHTALQAVESWIIRRALVRGTTQRYTDILTELITDIHKNGRDQVANRLTDFLRNQTSESSYWPDNTQLTSFLEFAPIYTTLARKRLRMILEAIEDDLRGLTRNSSSKSEQPCPRGKLTVEHILPQSWRDTWGLGDSPNIEERARRVHLLGNLTLLNQKLNSSVSNGPWQGQDGKKQALDQHSVLRLNSRLTEFVDKDWMNSSIDARTSYLIERLISIWPVPEGHSVIGVSQSKVTSSQIVEIPQLLSAGLLEVGSVLEAAPARLAGRTCVVLSDGTLETDDHQNFYSPSGAGRHISGTAAVGGWHFWRVRGTDKRLNELREEYRARFNVDMDSDAEEELEDEGGTV